MSFLLLYLELAAGSTLITCVLYALGRRISGLLGLHSPGQGFCILSVLAPLLAILWYVQGTSAWIYVIGVTVLLGFVMLILEVGAQSARASSAKRPLRYALGAWSVCGQFLPTAVAITGVYLAVSRGAAVASIGNNDMYNWATAAGSLVGKAEFANISPDAAEAWKYVQVDAFGTFWVLGLLSLAYESPIRALPLFLVTTLSWTCISTQWILVRLVEPNRVRALLASLLLIGSPFLLYIVFNAFCGQLLATFAAVVLVGVVLESLWDQSLSFVSRTILFVVPSLFIFNVYQSGFLVFLFVTLGLACFLSFVTDKGSGFFGAVHSYLLRALFPAATAVMLIFVLLPAVTRHLFERTVHVSTVSAGWPLPLIPPNVLLLPWIDPMPQWLYGGAGGTTAGYLVALLAISCLMVVLYRYAQDRESAPLFRKLAAAWIWYVVLVLGYFLFFLKSGGTYNAWKFASFFAFTLAFVPIATALALIRSAGPTQRRGDENGRWPERVARALALLALGSIIMWNLWQLRQRVFQLDSEFVQFEMMKQKIKPGWTLLLDLPPYGPSMLAMSILSKSAVLVPLAETYLPAVRKPIAPAHPSHVLVLTSRRCRNLYERFAVSSPPIFETQDFALLPLTDALAGVTGYAFAQGGAAVYAPRGSPGNGAACGFRGIEPQVGFSGSESWGTWTEGTNAKIRVQLPEQLRGGPLSVSLGLKQTYVRAKIPAQRVVIKADELEIFNGEVRDREPTVLELRVPDQVAARGEFDLTFHLPDAAAPKRFDAGSQDPRLLALGFHEMLIRRIDGNESGRRRSATGMQ
jgi:hypothetical protein